MLLTGQRPCVKMPPMTGFSEDPQAAYGLPLDKKSFLHWVQRQEGRFEFAEGKVTMQARITRGHSLVTNAFTLALRSRLSISDWNVLAEGFGIDVGDGIRYPDILVEKAGGQTSDLTTTTPVVLVEVLSPSSVGTDMTVKLAEYTSLASLEAYIVASQDEAICWVWQRQGEARAFPQHPQEVAGHEALFEIPALQIALPLAEIYRHIATG